LEWLGTLWGGLLRFIINLLSIHYQSITSMGVRGAKGGMGYGLAWLRVGWVWAGRGLGLDWMWAGPVLGQGWVWAGPGLGWARRWLGLGHALAVHGAWPGLGVGWA